MYSTCIGCGRELGSNSIISRCRVGRRIAFDAERGRLWVICHRCDRWNLVPIEERWEAIEECRSLASASSVVGENAGVTAYRPSRGVTLFQVGPCTPSRLAQWRYAPLVRRRREFAMSPHVDRGAGCAISFPAHLRAALPGII